MQPNTRLNKDDCDKNPAPDFHRHHRGIVGGLRYLVTMTRPGLATLVFLMKTLTFCGVG